MASLFDSDARTSILERVRRLSPESTPAWGRMNAPAMVCHVTSGLRHALGELDAVPRTSPMAHWPLNWLVIHVFPWPEGKATSPPEMLTQMPGSWTSDVERLEGLIHKLGTTNPAGSWPTSPTFGRISGRSWGVLQYRHLDHHLRQFRV